MASERAISWKKFVYTGSPLRVVGVTNGVLAPPGLARPPSMNGMFLVLA